MAAGSERHTFSHCNVLFSFLLDGDDRWQYMIYCAPSRYNTLLPTSSCTGATLAGSSTTYTHHVNDVHGQYCRRRRLHERLESANEATTIPGIGDG